MSSHIALFDIDGVLIHPGGYRAAVQKTLSFFIAELGLGSLWLPTEAELHTFEAQGITGEWDVIPLWLSLVLDTLGENKPDHWPTWQAAAKEIRNSQHNGKRSSFIPTIRSFGRFLRPGLSPSESILGQCQDGDEVFMNIHRDGVLAELLGITRNIELCRTTQVLQAFVLGDQDYSRIWKKPAPVVSRSTLAMFDQPLLSSMHSARLLDLHAAGEVRCAAYTARPSLPPAPGDYRRTGYTPEAESALHIVGLNSLPLVGYGGMQFMAERTGITADRLLKPAPFQALAAIAAAVTGDVRGALEWAYTYIAQFDQDQWPPKPLDWLELSDQIPAASHLTVDIFEDSPNGIRSGFGAVSLLAKSGIEVRIRPFGIASSHEKKTALEGLGAVIFPDINAALQFAWPDFF